MKKEYVKVISELFRRNLLPAVGLGLSLEMLLMCGSIPNYSVEVFYCVNLWAAIFILIVAFGFNFE